MPLPVVAVERTISAPAQMIFDLLADPAAHARFDGSGSVRSVTSDQPRLALGVTFGARMRLVLPYRITNRVVEFEEARRIAWRHFAGHRWRYVLTPTEDGTLVREEWDASRVPWWGAALLRGLGFPSRNRRGIEATLARLELIVSQP